MTRREQLRAGRIHPPGGQGPAPAWTNPEPPSPKEIPMSTKTSSNGQVRKSLGEQIDRLDRILDGLAEGLNEAVAAAVQEAVGVAVKEAVQAVVAEVLTNP